ncbi:MAG: alkaline phosphatase family protein [Lentisphaeria bacterium]|nr:alkaline phosphatase family protein [Lentisphaeria bacterium]
MRKICVIQIAGLSADIVRQHTELFAPLGMDFQPLIPPFPAVTCTAQATFRTGMDTARHGIVCNGVYSREQARVDFWNQSAHFMPPERIWSAFRRQGGTVGTICWQQSLGDDVDMILSPQPVHKHHGGMIQAFHSKPAGLYERLSETIGKTFSLFRYWGPTAGLSSTRWIAEATAAVIRLPEIRPDLLLTYLPHLDYVLQKQGPAPSKKVTKAVTELVAELTKVTAAAKEQGYELLIWGDYAITPATTPVYPNKVLREAGLMSTRDVNGMLYPDLHSSRAFAMVDHQIAHIFTRTPRDIGPAREALTGIPGIADISGHETMNHFRAGDLILTAEEGAWFAYPWWESPKQAPDYATHVDIHNKIGFDPCELFWGKLFPPTITLDTAKVRGTHGLTTAPAAWAGTLPELHQSGHAISLVALAGHLAAIMSQ